MTVSEFIEDLLGRMKKEEIQWGYFPDETDRLYILYDDGSGEVPQIFILTIREGKVEPK